MQDLPQAFGKVKRILYIIGIEPSMDDELRDKKLKGWRRAVRCALAWAEDEEEEL